MEKKIIKDFLINNLNEGIVIKSKEGEKYISSLNLQFDKKNIILMNECKIEYIIKEESVKNVYENSHNTLTIDTNNAKITLEEF